MPAGWVAGAAAAASILAQQNAAKKAREAQKQMSEDSINAQKDGQKLDPRIDQLIYGQDPSTRKLKDGVTQQYTTVPAHTEQQPDDAGVMHDVQVPESKTPIAFNESDYKPLDNGIVGRAYGLLDQPQSAGTSTFGRGIDNYMGQSGFGNYIDSQNAAIGLQGSNINAPQGALLWGMEGATIGDFGKMGAAKINAPSQNNLDLSGAYDQMINGNAAENPYLTAALQGGVNQSKNAFDRMQSDTTENLMKNILPSIRSNSILSGQYGGSRQGIAEGNAIGQFGKEMSRAASDYGQHNTDAILGAQAGAFDAGQNRSLSAMSGLGAEQYGVAGQDAGFQQQANATNYGGAKDAAMQYAANQQQAHVTNLGTRQQTELANLNAKIGTNQLNSQNQVSGIGLSSGLLGQAYGYQNNADNAQLARTGAVSGLLQPYANKGSVNVPQYQPTYNNAAGGAIGGAMAGLSLYNSFKAPSNQQWTGTGTNPNVNAPYNTNPYFNTANYANGAP